MISNPFAKYVDLPKPRIVRKDGKWLCDGIAFGTTPKEAFEAWRSYRIAVIALSTPLEFR